MNDYWNIMLRLKDTAHFEPIWHTGVDEHSARVHLAWRLRDTFWSQHEYQLVNHFSSHYEDDELVIDGWKKADA